MRGFRPRSIPGAADGPALSSRFGGEGGGKKTGVRVKECGDVMQKSSERGVKKCRSEIALLVICVFNRQHSRWERQMCKTIA